jgi:predicted negative regulator of RcsB-dependent stress response
VTLTEKLLAVVVGILLVLGVIFAYLYVQQVKLTAEAEAYGKAKDEVIAANQKRIEEAQKRIEQREKQWQREREAWEREKRAIKSQAQAVRVIEKYVPQVEGAVAEVKREELKPEIAEKLPDAPKYSVMPEQTAVEIAREIVECRKDQAALSKCEQDTTDLRAQVQAAEEKAQAAEQKAERWEKAAKGGGKVKRFFSTLGKVAVGVAIGVAISR